VDWLGQGALPFGLLVFFGMVLAVLRRRARFRETARAFPALGDKLGLQFKPAAHVRSIGTLSGELGGYQVFIDPDEQRRITVRFAQEPRVDLRNYQQHPCAPRGMNTYFSGNQRFDSFFQTRYLSDEVAQRLEQVADLGRLVEPFRGRYYRALKQLNVTSNGVSCVFDFGHPPHLPPAAIELLLPAMIELAQAIEPPRGGPHS
jgi:hypothetical protein